MSFTKKRILIVEDEKNLRDAYFRILKKNPEYEIDLAVSAEDTLRLFNVASYDLVITDIELPAMDGIEMLGEIKKRNRGIKVIVVSGSGVYLERAIKKGASDFIEKPVDINTLRDAVEKHITAS